MYVGRDWDVANTTESNTYSYDFTNDLQAGDSVIAAVFTLSVLTGVDATPASRLSGAAGLNVNNIVSQRVQFLLPGVVYILTATVTTQLGNTLTLYSHLPCQVII